MSEASSTRGGSSPDPTVRDRVLEAFVDQIERLGLPNVSIDQVARQAGVSKVTLYKRWPTRRELVIDAFRLAGEATPDLADHTDVRAAFDAVFARADSGRRHLRLRQLTAELVAASGYDEEARDVLVERQAMWRRFIRDVVELGKRTGEIPASRDTDRLVDVVAGVTVAGYLIDDHTPEHLVDLTSALLTDQRPV